MSINENQEFEAINQKTSERNNSANADVFSILDKYHARKAKAKKKAILFMVVTLLALVFTMLCITGLEMIGWINATFRIVLMCVAGCAAMFKTGYFWCEFKN